MSLIKSKLIQNITEANPHLFVRDVERIVNTIFSEITQSLADGGLEETASPQEVLDKIKQGLQDANIQVPDVALQSLAKNLQAQAATDQDGELSTTNIIRALEEGGDLANLFGEIGSKFQDALSSVRSAQDQVTNNLLRISDLQLKIARQEREFNLSQVKRGPGLGGGGRGGSWEVLGGSWWIF